MKKIFLIGDSIRLGVGVNKKTGYSYHLKELLRDRAEIYEPQDNCRFLKYTLRYLHEWAAELGIAKNIDTVIWNNGLWDALRIYDDEPFTSVEEYKAALPRVYKRITELFPTAKIYFPLSTAVFEKISVSKTLSVKNAELEEYNDSAKEILAPLGVEIIDLYSISSRLSREYRRDWIHFNEKGAKVLAEFIIEQAKL